MVCYLGTPDAMHSHFSDGCLYRQSSAVEETMLLKCPPVGRFRLVYCASISRRDTWCQAISVAAIMSHSSVTGRVDHISSSPSPHLTSLHLMTAVLWRSLLFLHSSSLTFSLFLLPFVVDETKKWTYSDCFRHTCHVLDTPKYVFWY